MSQDVKVAVVRAHFEKRIIGTIPFDRRSLRSRSRARRVENVQAVPPPSGRSSIAPAVASASIIVVRVAAQLHVSIHADLEQAIAAWNPGSPMRPSFFSATKRLKRPRRWNSEPRRLLPQALIASFCASIHCQRGNRVGISRQLCKGLKKFAPYLPSCEGIDTERGVDSENLPRYTCTSSSSAKLNSCPS